MLSCLVRWPVQSLKDISLGTQSLKRCLSSWYSYGSRFFRLIPGQTGRTAESSGRLCGLPKPKSMPMAIFTPRSVPNVYMSSWFGKYTWTLLSLAVSSWLEWAPAACNTQASVHTVLGLRSLYHRIHLYADGEHSLDLSLSGLSTFEAGMACT